jgi:hypothetical protein
MLEIVACGRPSTVALAALNAVAIVYGATGRPKAPTTRAGLPHSAGTRFSSSAITYGIGMGVFDISVFNGSDGSWIVGLMTPRMKSTSTTRSAAIAATRKPANAPRSTTGFIPSAIAR